MKQFQILIWVLALSVSVLGTFLISFIDAIPKNSLWPIALVIFFSTLFLGYLAIRFFIIREVEKIEGFISKWSDYSHQKKPDQSRYLFKRTRNIDKSLRALLNQREAEIGELKKMADFRKDFIANISHELKTPLFSAQGFVHTLLDGAIKDKTVRNRFLKKAAKSLDNLDLLIQDLLTLSQIEIGNIRMHKEYFDINKLASEVVDQLEETAEKKWITIRIKSEGQVLVFADYKRIKQVMTNLIVNAINYNKENGWVKVSLKENKKYVRIEVKDSGEGIAEEHQERIFERFYRVEKSRSRLGGGTGLGLAIVKHIVEGHDSEISLASKLGKGTTFSFNLANDD